MTFLDKQNDAAPVETTERRIHTDNYVLNELKRIWLRSNDAFGRIIADGTRNSVDIPAYTEFNPERLRLFENDTRVRPADIPTQFTDTESTWQLTPDAGNTLTIFTAERPRYIVGYEGEASTASKATNALGAGDTLEIGLSDRQTPVNKAYFEINGGSDNRLVLVGQGSEVATTTFTFPEGVDETTPIRYEIQFNWYNVGRYRFNISYTDSSRPKGSRQVNKCIGELTVDDDFATGDGAYHIYQRVDATNAGVDIHTGSYGYTVLGRVDVTTRTKSARITGLSYGGSGQYEALAALRIDPNRGNVFTQLKNLTVFPDGGSGELLAIVTSQENTDATGFSAPPQHSPRNSIIEQTTDVSTFPQQDGTIVTQTNNPNGYQVGLATFESAGTGTNARIQTNVNVENKRPLYEDDVCIFLYKADTATARSVNFTHFTEQDF